MKILILANHYNTLRIFRRELIKTISDMGHEIVISIPTCDYENKMILESYGSKVVFTDFERRGMNPLKDINLLYEYRRLIKSEKPDKVITYTIKCNIYGGFACKHSKIPYYTNITGLGSAFQRNNITQKLVSVLYKRALKKAARIFFENVGNRDTLVVNGVISLDRSVVLNGAGVNLQEFQPSPYPDNDVLRFLFVGRIMREKGVDEYFEAIKRIKSEYSNIEFDFIGWYEEDYEQIVKDMQNKGIINFHGFQADVKPFIVRSHCVVLPSWHEGMSNTLLESAAMCRPLITTNIHGCKEAVIDGVTGILSNAKDADSLYTAIKQFIGIDHNTRAQMGVDGRKHMESKFDKNEIICQTIAEIFD